MCIKKKYRKRNKVKKYEILYKIKRLNAKLLLTAVIISSIPVATFADKTAISTIEANIATNTDFKNYAIARHNYETLKVQYDQAAQTNNITLLTDVGNQMSTAKTNLDNIVEIIKSIYDFGTSTPEAYLDSFYATYSNIYAGTTGNPLNVGNQSQDDVDNLYAKWVEEVDIYKGYFLEELETAKKCKEDLISELQAFNLYDENSTPQLNFNGMQLGQTSTDPTVITDKYKQTATIKLKYIKFQDSINRLISYYDILSYIEIKNYSTNKNNIDSGTLTSMPSFTAILQSIDPNTMLSPVDIQKVSEANDIIQFANYLNSCFVDSQSNNFEGLFKEMIDVSKTMLTNRFIDSSSSTRKVNIADLDTATSLPLLNMNSFYNLDGNTITASNSHIHGYIEDPNKSDEIIYSNSMATDTMGTSLLLNCGMLSLKHLTGKVEGTLTADDLKEIKHLSDYLSNAIKEFEATITFYKRIGYNGLAGKLQSILDAYKDALKAVETQTGVSLISSTVNTKEEEIVSSDIFSDGKLTESGARLYGWTACFSPLTTNVFEINSTGILLTEDEKALYTNPNRDSNYLQLYMVANSSGAYVALANGATKKLKTVTLGDLVDTVDKGDIILFADTRTGNAKEEAKQEQAAAEEQADKDNITLNIADTDYSGSESFIGPVYMSAPITAYTDGDESIYYSDDQKETNDDIDQTLVASKSVNVNIADLKKNSGTVSLATKSVSIDMLHLNHMILHNCIEENRASISSKDSYLFIDKLGNIITEEGYVVIPAASNTTYYKNGKYYPIYNAALLNTYPILTYKTDKEVQIENVDKDKIAMGYTIRFDKKGATSEDDYTQQEKGFYSYKTNSLQKLCTASNFGTGEFIWSDDEDESVEPLDFLDPVDCFIATGENLSTGHLFWKKYFGTSYFTLNKTNLKLNIPFNSNIFPAVMNKIPPLNASPIWGALIDAQARYHLKYEEGLDVQLLQTIQENVDTKGEDITTLMMLTDNIVKTSYKDMDADIGFSAKLCAGLENLVINFYRNSPKNALLRSNTFSKDVNEGFLSIAMLPIASIAVAILFVIMIIYFVIVVSRGDMNNKVLKSFLVLTIVTIVTIYVGIPTIDECLTTVPILAEGDALYDHIMYKEEDQYKEDLSAVYTHLNVSPTLDNAELRLFKLSSREVKEYRQSQSTTRAEINSPVYNATYDSNKYTVVPDVIYMHHNYLYTTVDALFNSVQVKTVTNNDYYNNLEIATTSTQGILQPYTPFYLIMEGFTQTVNAFNEGNINSYKLINYGQQQKGAGRCSAYIHSIFFMQPDAIPEYTEKLRDRNIMALNNSASSLDAEEYEKRVDAIETNAEYAKAAFQYIQENLGENDDWLNLRCMLYLKEDNGVFENFDMESITSCRWNPLNNGFTLEQVESKIIKVNQRTKDYVLSHISPISHLISDETCIKLIALKASIEFNKEFSTDQIDLYPKRVEAEYIDNKYFTVASYMPRTVLYTTADQSLAYYVFNKAGGWGIFFTTLERFLLRIITVLYSIDMKVFVFIPILAIFFITFKDTPFSLQFWKAVSSLVSVIIIRILHILALRFLTWLVNYIGIEGAIGANTVLTLTVLFLVARANVDIFRYIKEFIKSCFYSLAGLTRYLGNKTIDQMYAKSDNYYKNGDFYKEHQQSFILHQSSPTINVNQQNYQDFKSINQEQQNYEQIQNNRRNRTQSQVNAVSTFSGIRSNKDIYKEKRREY